MPTTSAVTTTTGQRRRTIAPGVPSTVLSMSRPLISRPSEPSGPPLAAEDTPRVPKCGRSWSRRGREDRRARVQRLGAVELADRAPDVARARVDAGRDQPQPPVPAVAVEGLADRAASRREPAVLRLEQC